MLDRYQKALLKAYGKAKLTLKSYAVIADNNYTENDKEMDYIIVSCEEAMTSYRSNNYHVVKWMHSNITPCWGEYDISENDFIEYMNKRFPDIYKNPTIHELIAGTKNNTVKLIDTFVNANKENVAHFRTNDGNNYYYFKERNVVDFHN